MTTNNTKSAIEQEIEEEEFLSPYLQHFYDQYKERNSETLKTIAENPLFKNVEIDDRHPEYDVPAYTFDVLSIANKVLQQIVAIIPIYNSLFKTEELEGIERLANSNEDWYLIKNKDGDNEYWTIYVLAEGTTDLYKRTAVEPWLGDRRIKALLRMAELCQFHYIDGI